MALVYKDRVLETSTTTGTGAFTLAGTLPSFQTFAAIGNGNTCYYTITAGSEWEVGLGTYTASGTSLSRDVVLDSSNSGSLVNFAAGTKTVFVTFPADVANTAPKTYPSAGIAVSTGSAWGTSKTSPTGDVVGTTDNQTLTNKTISMSGLLTQSAGADIASASTVNLTAATGNCPKITGTTDIEVWTMNTGQQMKCIAGGAFKLVYDATTNNIEGGTSYTCSAGDIINLVKGLDGVVRVRIEKQDGGDGVPVGGYVFVQTNLTGAQEPSPTRYIKLTAGLTGSGQYNEGKLTSESVTGSAPLVVATAVIDDAGSPMDGQTVNLINTENRYIMPGTSAGTVANDQMQLITGSLSLGLAMRFTGSSGAFTVSNSTNQAATSGSASGSLAASFNSSNSSNARTGTSTNVKHIQVTAYMRIK